MDKITADFIREEESWNAWMERWDREMDEINGAEEPAVAECAHCGELIRGTDDTLGMVVPSNGRLTTVYLCEDCVSSMPITALLKILHVRHYECPNHNDALDVVTTTAQMARAANSARRETFRRTISTAAHLVKGGTNETLRN